MSISSFIKKLVIVISIVTFILFIAILVAAWYMGLFSDVTIHAEQRGPYRAVVLAHQGAYRQTYSKIDSVMTALDQVPDKTDITVGLYYDDPAKVPVEALRSEAGALVTAAMEVSSPYRFIEIPRRPVLVAGIKANPALAGFKTYPALQNWIEKNQMSVDTTQAIIELYYPDGRVEVEVSLNDTTEKQ